MRQRVFGTRAFQVVAAFEITGIVHQNRQQTQFKDPGRQKGLDACDVASAQQAGQTECSLQRMLKIVISGINGLEPRVFASKKLLVPTEASNNEARVSLWEKRRKNELDFGLDRGNVAGVHD
jgi:hypothetical protein